MSNTIYFKDIQEASEKLVSLLPKDILSSDETVVISVSKEGLFFAKEIANSIHSELDILITQPIVAPNNSLLCIAMVSETQEVIINKALISSFSIDEDYIYKEANRQYKDKILGNIETYRKGKELLSVEGKYVVLVDDCIETGLSMMLALKSVIQRGAKNIFIVTPILDKIVYDNLITICDGVFCIHTIQDYISIEYYYENFDCFDYENIIELIGK